MESLKNESLENQAMNFYVTGKIVEVAKCENCKYTFKNSLTPTVTSISTNTLKGGDEIVLQGTQLKSTNNAKVILHNDTTKTEVNSLTANSTTEVKFNMPEITNGSYIVNVLVEDLGYAKFNTGISQELFNQLSITSVTPNTGNKGG